MIKIKITNPFKLEETITCGQIFRFYKMSDDSYDIILKDRVINVYMKDKYLYASSNLEENLEEVIINYFDLNNDYSKINSYLKEKDELLTSAINYSNGLKMIKQDPFETIIEYIISANNKVERIAESVNNIAIKYGKKVLFNNKEYYLFPDYETLKDVSLEEYRTFKVGFRDKYLKKIIERLNNNEFDLNDFYKLDTKSSLNKLMENIGIGPKVASCILLFAYQKYDVFPIDTWVKKIMKNNYNLEKENDIKIFAEKNYKDYSGIAIQYLFNYSRNNKTN